MARPSEEYGVAAAGMGARAAVFDLYLKSGAGQQPFKCGIGGGGPEGHTSSRLKRGTRRCKARVVVETVVGSHGQTGGAVIDVEEDGVESARVLSNHFGDVLLEDFHPRVRHGAGSERVKRISIPGDDGSQDFGHLDCRIGGEDGKRRPKGKAEAQASDQHAGTCSRFQVGAGQARERFLRGVLTSGHERGAIHANGVAAIVFVERDDFAVGGESLVESGPLFHGRKRRGPGLSAPWGIVKIVCMRIPLLLLVSSSAVFGAGIPYLTEPSLCATRPEIAFTSGGDIWVAPAKGGEAHLLVSHPADESHPL